MGASASAEREPEGEQQHEREEHRDRQMAREGVALPLELFKQEKFASKIEKINSDVFEHTNFLKRLIERHNEVYMKMTRDIRRMVTSLQRKMEGEDKLTRQMLEFMRSIGELAQIIEGQVSKNIIYLGSKKHDGLGRINEMIRQKLGRAGIMVREFMGMVKEYNSLGKLYKKKCEYFMSIETKPVAFYSLKKNSEKYLRVVKMEEELAKDFDRILSAKNEIRIMFIELSVKLSEFYENIRIRLEEFRKLVDSTRDKVNSFVTMGLISQIQEDSNEEYSSASNQISFSQRQVAPPQPTDKLPVKHRIKTLKREKMEERSRKRQVEEAFLTFLESFCDIMDNTEKNVERLSTGRDFEHFSQQKTMVSQRLSPRSINDIESIFIEHRDFVTICFRVKQILNPKIFEEKFRFGAYAYERFLEELDVIVEKFERDESILDKEFSKLVSKLESDEEANTAQLTSQVSETMEMVMKEFKKKSLDQGNRFSKRNDIFSNFYFEVLKLPFFERNAKIEPFSKPEWISRYEDIMDNKRMKKACFELEAENGGAKRTRSRSRCCGLVSHKATTAKAKKNKKIDSYICALKCGPMLFQGSMIIYEEFLRFKSSFNPNTFFGATDIQIPHFDIVEVISGRHVMVSPLVTLITKHGNIEFTSFIVDPAEVLRQRYCQPSMNNSWRRQNPMVQKSELCELTERLRNQFCQEARDKGFNVKETEINKANNILSVKYHYLDLQGAPAEGDLHRVAAEDLHRVPAEGEEVFLVKISQYDNVIDYVFWHSNNNAPLRKKLLQDLAKRIIDDDRIKKADTQFEEADEYPVNKEPLKEISFQMSEKMSSIGEAPKEDQDQAEPDDMPSFMRPLRPASSSEFPLGSRPALPKLHRPSAASRVVIQNPTLQNSYSSRSGSNKTNSFAKQERSINSVISEKASTVKRDWKLKESSRKSAEAQKSKQAQKIKSQEGMQKVLGMMMLAILLLSVLKWLT